MGTPRLFDGILKQELNIHAAWLPVINTFKLGDFGLVSDGVLVKAGNISEFGVALEDEVGPASKLNFASKGTRIVRVVGGAQVDALPDTDLEAKLTIEFERETSFFLRANLLVQQMRSLQASARKLSQADGWDRRFRVVSALYTGKQCVILSSKAANSKIELTGKASALKQLELGSASGDFHVSSSEQIGLEIVGKSGVVGLSLFKLSWWPWSDRPKVLGPDDEVPIETDQTWPTELEDDV